MMGSKTFLFVGLLLAVFLMISSEVVARELAETSPAVKLDNENEVEVDHHHGGGCHHRCHGHCCSYEEYVAMGKVTESSSEVKLDNENDAEVDGRSGYNKGGGYHKGGGYRKGGGYKRCRYRCHGRCCSYEEYMAMGKVTETQTQN